jgi:hypothetical protein
MNKTVFGPLMRWTAVIALLPGCRAKAPPPSVADLHFPVAVIFGKAGVVMFKDAQDLGTMRIGHLNGVISPPPLIDSHFSIYTLAKLGSTHGGLWLMAHPTGFTPVTFELERAPKSGIEAARELIRSQLDAQTWRQDLEYQRGVLAAQQTLSAMVATLRPDGG